LLLELGEAHEIEFQSGGTLAGDAVFAGLEGGELAVHFASRFGQFTQEIERGLEGVIPGKGGIEGGQLGFG